MEFTTDVQYCFFETFCTTIENATAIHFMIGMIWGICVALLVDYITRVLDRWDQE